MDKVKKVLGNIIYWAFRSIGYAFVALYVLMGIALVVGLFIWNWVWALAGIAGVIAVVLILDGAEALYEASERWAGRSRW